MKHFKNVHPQKSDMIVKVQECCCVNSRSCLEQRGLSLEAPKLNSDGPVELAQLDKVAGKFPQTAFFDIVTYDAFLHGSKLKIVTCGGFVSVSFLSCVLPCRVDFLLRRSCCLSVVIF